MLSNTEKPFVSVIIPVLNGVDSIEKNLQALQIQNYPKNLYEIIIVDNGSTDGTVSIVEKYTQKDSRIKILSEKIKSSYAARNTGINITKGEILAFTDCDCVPDYNWITSAVNEITDGKNIIGGKVHFTFSEKPTAAEYADALINIDNEDSIKKHGMAATANIFITKETLKIVGNFNQNLKSGGDGEWCARAKKSGEDIIYCGESIVYHPARNIYELIKKHIRIGSGSIAVWDARGKSFLWELMAFMYLLTPIYCFKIPSKIKAKLDNSKKYPIIKIMLVVYICKITTAIGIIKVIFKK